MSNNVKYLKSNNQVTVYLNGTSYSMSMDNPNFKKVSKILKNSSNLSNRNAKKLENLFSKKNSIIEYFDSYGTAIVVEDGVIHYGELEIKSSIVDRILEMKNRGIDPSNLLRFVERLADNPSTQSVNELYEFLAKNNIPIQPDGRFLCYKKVRHDYTDIHSGEFDNSPGKFVFLEGGRIDVDPDRNQTCSNGLHVCAYNYLDCFGSGSQAEDRVIVVAVDPKDVVTVPIDYNNAKMRVVGYEVLKDIGDWRTIRLKDFAVNGEDIFINIDDEDDEYYDPLEDYEGYEEEEDNESDVDFDEYIKQYNLMSDEGLEYLEDFANFMDVEYKAGGNEYCGYILSVIPAHRNVHEIIKLAQDNLLNTDYFVMGENPHSFLSYFEYVSDIKRKETDYDRYLVVLTIKNGEVMNELRLATPSKSTLGFDK